MIPADSANVMEEAARIRFRRVSHGSHAGGVVFQRPPEVAVKFLVVSSLDGTAFVLPKGRIEPGEHARTAALREVQEETGYASEQCAALGVFQFVSPSGVPPDVLPILARAEAELARPR